MSSIKKNAISGTLWVLAERFSVQGLNFFVSVVLARLLFPAEFGLIGMIYVFITIGQTLVDGGLTSSLIRTPVLDELDYSTVFVINLFGSILIYCLIFICAPFIADFYNQPILISLIRVLSLVILIRALNSIQVTRLVKTMAFKRQFIIEIPSTVAAGITGIIMAYRGFGVWSLVAMQLVAAIGNCIQLWIFSDWKPSIRFNTSRFNHHFKFGVNLTFSGILDAVFENAYNIIIGRIYPPAQLGYYSRAQSLQQLPVNNISSALLRVTFPLFSSIQEDNNKLKKAFSKIMQQVMFWMAPILIGLMSVAEPLFRLLFTEKWLPAVPYFQILCIVGIFYPISAHNLNILKVKGRSDIFFRLELVKKTMIGIGIVCSLPFGIFGLLYFQVIAAVLAFILNGYYSGKIIDFPVREQISVILKPLLIAVLMGILSNLVCRGLNAHTDITKLLAAGASGLLFYLFCNILTRQAPALEFCQFFLKRKFIQ